MKTVEQIANILRKRTSPYNKSMPEYYAPLDKEDSNIICNYFREHIYIPLSGNNDMRFYNKDGTLVATGYSRVVVGDYGPFVEFSKDQIVSNNIKNRWDSNDVTKKIKYIWMQTKDVCKTKVYNQVGIVPYADYKIGMYYIDPYDLHTDELELLYDG